MFFDAVSLTVLLVHLWVERCSEDKCIFFMNILRHALQMGSLDCLVFTASHASTSRELKVVNGNFTHAGFLDLNMRNEIHEKFISLFISLTIYQSVYIYILFIITYTVHIHT